MGPPDTTRGSAPEESAMRVIGLIAVALIASPLLAQQDEATKAKSAKAVYEELNAEFMEARSEYIAVAQERRERLDLNIPAKPFLARFEASAEKYAGTEDAVPFLTWIVMNSLNDETRVNHVIAEILVFHLESPQLVSIASSLSTLGATIGEERVAQLKSVLLERGHPEVKATMLFFSGYYALMDRNATAEANEAALEDLRQAAKFGGQYGGMAQGMVFERERLQIGMEAPDIVGDDLDGVNFSLSDYRGKVVVIDFWGDW